MSSSRSATVFGMGMIAGAIPCTLASILIWQLTVALDADRAAGRHVGFDVIGVVLASYSAFLVAAGTCVAGLVYFGYAVLVKRTVALRRWQRCAIAYSVLQAGLAALYVATR